MRRWGLLPGGMPDGLGQDDDLSEARLPHTVMVYFPDTRESLYQIEQWYGPLRALDARHRVVVVCMDSRAAARIREGSRLDVLTVARGATLDGLIARSEIKLVLYVNHNPQNFSAMRYRSVIHVSMLHGDSDKSVSVSNQVKGYDVSMVAGRAAVDRLSRHTMLFDAPARCLEIGRPQLDTDVSLAAEPHEGGLPTVMYAPTWEGAEPSVAYGSVDSHGLALVNALLDSGRYRVVYRPHPLAGVRLAEYGDADGRIRTAVAAAAQRSPQAGHTVDQGGSLLDSFATVDLLVCDVSAVANDWLPTLRPVVVTVPHGVATQVAATPLLDTVPRLTVEDLDRACEILDEALHDDPSRDDRLALVEYYLGDTSPGAALRRFLDACDELIVRRDQEWARMQQPYH